MASRFGFGKKDSSKPDIIRGSSADSSSTPSPPNIDAPAFRNRAQSAASVGLKRGFSFKRSASVKDTNVAKATAGKSLGRKHSVALYWKATILKRMVTGVETELSDVQMSAIEERAVICWERFMAHPKVKKILKEHDAELARKLTKHLSKLNPAEMVVVSPLLPPPSEAQRRSERNLMTAYKPPPSSSPHGRGHSAPPVGFHGASPSISLSSLSVIDGGGSCELDEFAMKLMMVRNALGMNNNITKVLDTVEKRYEDILKQCLDVLNNLVMDNAIYKVWLQSREAAMRGEELPPGLSAQYSSQDQENSDASTADTADGLRSGLELAQGPGLDEIKEQENEEEADSDEDNWKDDFQQNPLLAMMQAGELDEELVEQAQEKEGGEGVVRATEYVADKIEELKVLHNSIPHCVFSSVFRL